MKEHFIIKLPSYSNTFTNKKFWNILISIILSICITYPVLGILSIPALLSIIILFCILYLILSSISGENLSNELPNTLYPSLPHTGLDGISLNSYVTGLDILEKKY
jgi:hypothetical protein